MDFANDILPLLTSALRVSTPLAFAALGGFLSERSGVVNIALEGKMLAGAFVAAVVAHYTGNVWAGAGGAIAAGGLLGLLYALFVVTLRSNQIIVGTAVNFLAAGLAPFFANVLFGTTSSTPSLPADARFTTAPFVILAVVLVALAWFSRKSLGGLWHRVAGEHPEALLAAGASVARTRYVSLLCCGALAGFGGATLSLLLSSGFARNMTAGRGFMALAALILGKWRPVPAFLACLLFGFFEAAQIRLQGVTLWGEEPVPVQFIAILPYVVTLLLLAGFIGRSRAPRALGTPLP